MITNVVFLDACTSPFEPVGDGCFFYSEFQVDSYEIAAAQCANIGGRLAVVKEGDVNRKLVSHFFGHTSKLYEHLLLADFNVYNTNIFLIAPLHGKHTKWHSVC